MHNNIFIVIAYAMMYTFGCDSDSSREIIQSPDGAHSITAFKWTKHKNSQSFVIITYGKYLGEDLPDSYLMGKQRYRDGWECLIEWKHNNVVIYEPYGLFEEHNLMNSPIEHLKMKDKDFHKYFYREDLNLWTSLFP